MLDRIDLFKLVNTSVLKDPNADSNGAVCRRKQIQLFIMLNMDKEVGITFTDGNEKFILQSSTVNIKLLSRSLI